MKDLINREELMAKLRDRNTTARDIILAVLFMVGLILTGYGAKPF